MFPSLRYHYTNLCSSFQPLIITIFNFMFGAVMTQEENCRDFLELLEEYGPIPGDLKARILSEVNLDTLKRWHKLSARVHSVEAFVKELETEDRQKCKASV